MFPALTQQTLVLAFSGNLCELYVLKLHDEYLQQYFDKYLMCYAQLAAKGHIWENLYSDLYMFIEILVLITVTNFQGHRRV